MSAPSKSTSPSKERALGSRSLNDKGDAGLKKSAVDVEKGRDTAVAGNSPQCKADVTVPRRKEKNLRDDGDQEKKGTVDAEKRSGATVTGNSPQLKADTTSPKRKEKRSREDGDQENTPDAGSPDKRPRGRSSIGLSPTCPMSPPSAIAISLRVPAPIPSRSGDIKKSLSSQARAEEKGGELSPVDSHTSPIAASSPVDPQPGPILPLSGAPDGDADGKALPGEGGEKRSTVEPPLEIYEGLAAFLASCKSDFDQTSRWFRRENNHFTCDLPDGLYSGSKCKFAYLASEFPHSPAGEPMRLHLKEEHGFQAFNWKNARREGICEWKGCPVEGEVRKDLGPHVVQQHGFKFLCPFYRCLHCYAVDSDGHPRYKRECMATCSSREEMRNHLREDHGVEIKDLSKKCNASWDCLTVGRDVHVCRKGGYGRADR